MALYPFWLLGGTFDIISGIDDCSMHIDSRQRFNMTA